MYRPGQLPGRAFVISGELQAGGNSICLCLTGVPYEPLEGHSGQHAYTFVIRILSTSLTSVLIFSAAAALVSTYLSGRAARLHGLETFPA
jgi:hypothetical protein